MRNIEKYKTYQKSYQKPYRKKTTVKRSLYHKRYYEEHFNELKEYHKKYRASLRLSVLSFYGGSPPKCECCGENHIEFLTIHHNDGNGAKDRKINGAGLNFYKWLIKHNFPNGYRILCWNCNMAIGGLNSWKGFGYCPHEKERK